MFFTPDTNENKNMQILMRLLMRHFDKNVTISKSVLLVFFVSSVVYPAEYTCKSISNAVNANVISIGSYTKDDTLSIGVQAVVLSEIGKAGNFSPDNAILLKNIALSNSWARLRLVATGIGGPIYTMSASITGDGPLEYTPGIDKITFFEGGHNISTDTTGSGVVFYITPVSIDDRWTKDIKISMPFDMYLGRKGDTLREVKVNGPAPVSEYEDAFLRVRINIPEYILNVESPTSIGLITGVRNIPTAMSFFEIECVRPATPLTLSIQEKEIDFGFIQTGDIIPVTKELNWNASGTGITPLWTIRFESTATSGDEIILGRAKVSIQDINGNNVPLATDLSVNGIAGKYFFVLHPDTGLPGEHMTAVNITLTAH